MILQPHLLKTGFCTDFQARGLVVGAFLEMASLFIQFQGIKALPGPVISFSLVTPSSLLAESLQAGAEMHFLKNIS